MIRKLGLAVVLFIIGQVPHSGWALNPLPNLGDLRLKNSQVESNGVIHGQVQAFFTDGSFPTGWTSICSPKFAKQWEGTTACKQLGYQNCTNIRTIDRVDSDPALLTNFDCNQQSFDHLFHCSHNLTTNSSCDTIIELYCDSPKVKTPYSGQVSLCAPDNSDQNLTYPTQSVSTGIAAIYFYKEYGALSFLRETKALTEEITHYRGNLICQQQGFQQAVPGSVQTVKSYKAAGYQFNKCNTPFNGGIYVSTSWISNRDLNCESKNYKDIDCTSTSDDPCFSCCFNQPDPNSKIETDFDNYVVVQCIFDVYSKQESVPYGNKSVCEFPSNFIHEDQKILMYHSVCAAGSHSGKHDDTGYITWTVISTIIIFIVIITILGWIIKKLYNKCHCDYEELYENKEQNQHQQPNPQS